MPRIAGVDLNARAHRVLAVAALGSMLMLLAVSVSAPQLAGWQPNHGHATLAGAVLPHEHPSDHAHDHHDTTEDRDGLVFTFADDGSVTSPTSVPTDGWLPAGSPVQWSERSPSEGSPADIAEGVPAPPPRV